MITETTTQLSTLVGFKLWSCGSTPAHLHTCTPDSLQCQVIGWDQPQPGGLSWFTSCIILLKRAGPDLRNQLALPVLMSFPVLRSLGHHAGVRHHQREVLRQHQELDSQYRGGRPRPFDVTWLLWFSELTLFRVGFDEVFKEMLVWRHHRIMWSVI